MSSNSSSTLTMVGTALSVLIVCLVKLPVQRITDRSVYLPGR